MILACTALFFLVAFDSFLLVFYLASSHYLDFNLGLLGNYQLQLFFIAFIYPFFVPFPGVLFSNMMISWYTSLGNDRMTSGKASYFGLIAFLIWNWAILAALIRMFIPKETGMAWLETVGVANFNLVMNLVLPAMSYFVSRFLLQKLILPFKYFQGFYHPTFSSFLKSMIWCLSPAIIATIGIFLRKDTFGFAIYALSIPMFLLSSYMVLQSIFTHAVKVKIDREGLFIAIFDNVDRFRWSDIKDIEIRERHNLLSGTDRIAIFKFGSNHRFGLNTSTFSKKDEKSILGEIKKMSPVSTVFDKATL